MSDVRDSRELHDPKSMRTAINRVVQGRGHTPLVGNQENVYPLDRAPGRVAASARAEAYRYGLTGDQHGLTGEDSMTVMAYRVLAAYERADNELAEMRVKLEDAERESRAAIGELVAHRKFQNSNFSVVIHVGGGAVGGVRNAAYHDPDPIPDPAGVW